MSYADTAIDNARSQTLTPTEVMAMEFNDICTLSGVTEPVPMDFVYQSVRVQVANQLQQDIDIQAGTILATTVGNAILGINASTSLYSAAIIESALRQVKEYIATDKYEQAKEVLAGMGVNI
jgi:hypothetical protein